MKKYFTCKKFLFSASILAASLMCLSNNAHASYLYNNQIATSHVQLAPSTAPKRLAKNSSLKPNSATIAYKQYNPPKTPAQPSTSNCKAVITWESDGETGYYAQADITEVDAADGSVIWKPDYAHHINSAPWYLSFTTAADIKVNTQGFTGTVKAQLAANHASYLSLETLRKR